MRILHLSDIHVWRYTWDLRRLTNLRLPVTVELLRGRARRFRMEHLEAVMDHARDLAADHVLITGDLTTTALPAEFHDVRRALATLLTRWLEVTILPGNHDRTTGRSLRARRFEEELLSNVVDGV